MKPIKMGKLGEEVSQKIKSAIRAKLMELGIHMDNELPDYVMVLVANKKSQKQMENDLQLFLGQSTVAFTSWLHSVLKKLEQVTVSTKGLKKKTEEKSRRRHSCEESEPERKGSKRLKVSHEFNTEESLLDEKVTEEDLNEKEGGSSVSVKEEPMSENEDLDDDCLNLRADVEDEGDNFSENIETEEKEVSSNKDLEKAIEEQRMEESPTASPEQENSPPQISKERVKITWDKEEKQKKEEGRSRPRNRDSSKKPPERDVCPTRSWSDSNSREKSNSRSRSENRERNRSKGRSYSENRERDKSSGRSRSENNDKEKSNVRGRSENDDAEKRNVRSKSVNKDQDKYNVRSRSDNIDQEMFYVRTKEEMNGKKVVLDARDIINNKVSTSKKLLEKNNEDKESKKEKGGKKRKHLPSVGKPISNERSTVPEVTIPSLVKVSSRPVRRAGIQANRNLILKAVRDAEISVNTAKPLPKLSEIQQESKSNWKEFEEYDIPPAKISITVPNVRVPSTTGEEDLRMHLDEDEAERNLLDLREEKLRAKEKDEMSTIVQPYGTESSVEEMTFFSKEPLSRTESEPQFLITIGGDTSSVYENLWASDDPVLNDVEIQDFPDAESSSKDSQRIVYSKVPFNRSRLGPPPAVATVKPLQKNGAENMSTTNDLITLIDGPEKIVALKILEKCKFWPLCRAGDVCQFIHPTISCKLFPNCKYGDNCMYAHPPCKYGEGCLNLSCPYWHSASIKPRASLPPSVPQNQQCIYYPNCKNASCRFQHPRKQVCKYGVRCANWSCEFTHAPQLSLPSKDQLKWVARSE